MCHSDNVHKWYRCIYHIDDLNMFLAYIVYNTLILVNYNMRHLVHIFIDNEFVLIIKNPKMMITFVIVKSIMINLFIILYVNVIKTNCLLDDLISISFTIIWWNMINI